MTGMNRLSPLIVRRVGPVLPRMGRGTMRSLARPIAVAMPLHAQPSEGQPAEWLDDLKLFATGWIGGLIFFGTLLG